MTMVRRNIEEQKRYQFDVMIGVFPLNSWSHFAYTDDDAMEEARNEAKHLKGYYTKTYVTIKVSTSDEYYKEGVLYIDSRHVGSVTEE
jgi:hypothetical protein